MSLNKAYFTIYNKLQTPGEAAEKISRVSISKQREGAAQTGVIEHTKTDRFILNHIKH